MTSLAIDKTVLYLVVSRVTALDILESAQVSRRVCAWLFKMSSSFCQSKMDSR